jgi:TonB dependent receptor/CarboxypepD_reg-like domain/TonB-dependent Receptor Plug Domain
MQIMLNCLPNSIRLIRCACFLILILLQFNTLTVQAQQKGVGKIAGKALDLGNNEPLNGVSVTPKNGQRGTTSITDGTYILTLSPGTYTIRFSYTGYQTKEISGVIVKAGETTDLNILLEVATKAMESVVVTATIRKEAVASVYSAQKRSAAASDGISIESIRKTPDNNAGQILKRVTGVNVQDNRFVVVRGLGEAYNQTMLNGVPMTSTETNKNAFAFDLIPSTVIDNITINKTATPDMPGNFAGGIVQVNTKDFPSTDFVSVLIQGGFSDGTIGKDFYNDKRSKLEFLGFGAKSRGLPAGFPRQNDRVTILDVNAQEQIRYLRQLNNNIVAKNYGPAGLNENFQLGYGKTIKLRNSSQFGIVFALNQRKNQIREVESVVRNGQLLPFFQASQQNVPVEFNYVADNIRYRYNVDFGGALNLAYRFGTNKITLKNLATQVFNNQYIDKRYVWADEGFQSNTNDQVGISHIVEQKRIINSVLSGEHRTGKNNETRIDWNVNLTSISTITPDTRNFNFETDSGRTQFAIPGESFSVEASLRNFSRLWSNAKDLIYGGGFNITSPFQIRKSKQLFKTGILFQNRNRASSGTVLPYKADPRSTIDSLFMPSSYSAGYGTKTTLISASIAAGAANYNATSASLALYESIESKIGKKIRVIWGVRAENYQQSVNNGSFVYFPGFNNVNLVPSTTFASRNEFSFLPSVNFIYSPSDKSNVRLSYSQTVIRPELKDLAEFSSYDFQTFSVRIGNRALRSSSIRNVDAKFEYFPSASEIFSFSLFYKEITDPIEYIRSENSSIAFVRPLNIGTASVRGVEGEFRKKIDFVNAAKWLEHLTLFANGSLIESIVPATEVDAIFSPFVDEHRLSGQPKYIVNAGASLALFKNSFEATFSFNRTGDYIFELGLPNTQKLINGNTSKLIPDFVLRARDIGDLVLSQNFAKNKGKLKLNISNLFLSRAILYQDLNGNGRFDDPVVVVKTNPLAGQYVSGTDATSYSINPQRTYSFSIAYTF